MKKILLLLFLCSVVFGSIYAGEYKPGICPITGKTIISTFGKRLTNYRVAWFELDNGSRMPVAVDKDAMISEEDFDKIMEHVIAGWEWEISNKKWSPKQIQDYKDAFFNLKIKRILE